MSNWIDEDAFDAALERDLAADRIEQQRLEERERFKTERAVILSQPGWIPNEDASPVPVYGKRYEILLHGDNTIYVGISTQPRKLWFEVEASEDAVYCFDELSVSHWRPKPEPDDPGVSAEEIYQAHEEQEYWNALASWLGEGWRPYGWNRKVSVGMLSPSGRSYDIGWELARRLRREVKEEKL